MQLVDYQYVMSLTITKTTVTITKTTENYHQNYGNYHQNYGELSPKLRNYHQNYGSPQTSPSRLIYAKEKHK